MSSLGSIKDQFKEIHVDITRLNGNFETSSSQITKLQPDAEKDQQDVIVVLGEVYQRID